MKEPAKNIVASIQARLRNEADQQGKPFAEVLQYYAMEKFLYRLSKSEYVDKFVLKGGLLLYGWNIPLRRPTRDMDFRGYVENNERSVLKATREIIAQPVPEDGMLFDAKTIRVQQTQIDADYEGIRVKFTAFLGKAKIPMQIDIGFSDVLASRAERVDYPTILEEVKGPRLKGYPRESIVSEKFHAMIRHAQLNSRFKDYYDIWLIAQHFEFEGSSLQRAIEKTFAKRNTELPAERPVGLTPDFARTNQERWTGFLRKLKIQSEDVEDFGMVVNKIWSFLEHPLQVSVAGTQSTLNWVTQKGWV
jgi:predicted nucleotidyltransferase component of viral defense system